MNTISSSREANDHRTRLLKAMAATVGAKGYASVTIADVVRHACVSKRTFYEHFESKEACFLALFRAASQSGLRVLRDAVVPDKPWQPQLEDALARYFEHLAASPGLLRTLHVEVFQLGYQGEQARRQVVDDMASFMCSTVNRPQPGMLTNTPRSLSHDMATAAIGAINELVLRLIERDTMDTLPNLTPLATRIVHVLTNAFDLQPAEPATATVSPA